MSQSPWMGESDDVQDVLMSQSPWMGESDHVKVFVHGKLADKRKSFNGLFGMVKRGMGEDPLSGHLFIFISRRGNFIKVFYFDRSGYCIWSKRMEQGRFHWKALETTQMQWTDLKLLLEGVSASLARELGLSPHTLCR